MLYLSHGYTLGLSIAQLLSVEPNPCRAIARRSISLLFGYAKGLIHAAYLYTGMRRSALDFLGTQLPPEYHSAVADLSQLALLVGFYKRPVGKDGASTANETASGRFIDARLIKIDSDPGAFLHAASHAEIPQPAFEAAEAAAADLVAAVNFMVYNRTDLVQIREARLAAVRRVEVRLRPFGGWVASLCSGPSAEIASHMNLAFMGAVIDALEWPHVDAVRSWVYGFPLVGEIPDTGLFRREERPALRSIQSFTPVDNRAYEKKVRQQLSAADASEVARLVEKQTDDERRQNLIRGPFSRADLHRRFGEWKWRTMRRFGVVQGVKKDGSPKCRAIDNARASGGNDAAATHETITTISFAFITLCCRLVLAACLRLGIGMLAVLIGLEDMKAAYRQVPNSQPWYSVFALMYKGSTKYFYLPGLNFGFRASVLAFNSFPHLVVASTRVLLGTACDHYYDDYIIVDLAIAGESGQFMLQQMHVLFGQSTEPSKRLRMHTENPALGVQVSVEHVHTQLAVYAAPLVARIDNVLSALDNARFENSLPPGLASSLLGQLGFIMYSSYARVGRGALQPLLQRAHFDTSESFSPALRDMLEFLRVFLRRLPTLRMSIQRDDRPPLVCLTDACFYRLQDGSPFSRLGFTIWCPRRRRIVHSHVVVPPLVYQWLAPDKETLISQCEAIAPLVAMYSMPELFRGQRALFFLDNTAALSAHVHGTASKPDLSRIANAMRLMCLALECNPWFEWVPSEANLADLPSRLKYELYFSIAPESSWFDCHFPPFDSLFSSLQVFFDLLM